MVDGRVVGIDLGKRRLAVGWPARALSDSIDLGKKIGPRGEELHVLSNWLAEVLPFEAQLWAEVPFSGHGAPQSGLDLAETLGAVRVSRSWLTEVNLVHQGTWKKEVVGDGGASKSEVRAWLQANHPALYEKTLGQEDRVDAMCIGIYGSMRSQGLIEPPVKKPKKVKNGKAPR